MTSGILRTWYIKRLQSASTPTEYLLALQALSLYEVSVFNANLKGYFRKAL